MTAPSKSDLPAHGNRSDGSESSAATCTACSAPQAASKDPFYYDWKDRRFWIYRCRSCTHQFVYPPVTEQDQKQIYSDHYFSAQGDWAVGVFAGGYTDETDKLIREANEVLDMLPAGNGKRLLDIGCAGGVFLSVAAQRGFAVSGIEINPTMAEHARRTYGLEVHNGRIEDVPGMAEPIDVVTILDVLEHVPAPLDALTRVGTWMKPGATLLVRGPLANSQVGKLKEALRRLANIPKQLPGYPLDANMFNKRSLTAALKRAGFGDFRWINAGPDFANLVAVRQA